MATRHANIPMKQFAWYLQDDWRVNGRLTVNMGLRWDYITGYQIDQSKNPNFVKMQNAGRAGLLAGIKGLENFGLDPKEDSNNWQPRIGLAYDVRGNGRDVVRAGWGIYYDIGYTNSNGLFAASDATGKGFGTVFNVDNQSGIRNPDGTLLQSRAADLEHPVAEPGGSELAAAVRSVRGSAARRSHTRDRRPSAGRISCGRPLFSRSTSYAIDGRDLNVRPRINTFPVNQPSAARRLAFVGVLPNAIGTRPAVSRGKSEYTALILGIRRRMLNGIDFSASYTLAEAKSTNGTASDELNAINLQEAEQLYDDPRVFGPTGRTDARHQGTLAAIFQVKGGFTVSPIFLFRSALPVAIIEGLDTNQNGERNDLPVKAYQFDGVRQSSEGDRQLRDVELRPWRIADADESARVEGVPPLPQLSRGGDRRGLQPVQREEPGDVRHPDGCSATERRTRISCSRPNIRGDFQNPEQRVGQIGFRFTF